MTFQAGQYRGFIAPFLCSRFSDANHVRLRGHRIVLRRQRQSIRLASPIEHFASVVWKSPTKAVAYATSSLKKCPFVAHLRNLHNSQILVAYETPLFQNSEWIGDFVAYRRNPCAPSLRSAHHAPVKSLSFYFRALG